ncbi:M48 family metallopeptidase [Crenobacter sp. HX-7-9]|uniref:M48 family metallopeptidase n=1 Tax=Crenobacter caeni TaxID=2705474 RepID=A0A6B2KVY4_9NEIS|nr:M48 family metallopeptidase [Crenobacter caeni]
MPASSLPELGLPLTLIRRPRKRVSLRVGAAGAELIADPAVPVAWLADWLEQKKGWLLERYRAARRAGQTPPASLLWQGRALALECRAGTRAGLRFTDGAACLTVPARELADAEALRARLSALLQSRARTVFNESLAAFGPSLMRKPAAWRLSSARSRWGSCNAAGVVRLNWRLVMAPPAVLSYVVAHELAHLMHMNHSAAFWSEVDRLHPSWRADRDWLKTHGASLFSFG